MYGTHSQVCTEDKKVNRTMLRCYTHKGLVPGIHFKPTQVGLLCYVVSYNKREDEKVG